MRNEYRKIIYENIDASQNFLGDLYEGCWKLVEICSQVITKSLLIDGVADDQKRTIILIMLRNSISDICSYLDSLERGHLRGILNNLRMTIEDFCCVVHINHDGATYQKFINSKHQASNSIGAAKTLRPHDKQLAFLYGELSKISHHQSIELIARQMASRDGLLSHIMRINPEKLHLQIFPFQIIIYLLREIREFAEEVSFPFMPKPYFWLNQSTRNRHTDADKVIQKLIHKTQIILKKTQDK